jgi:predicted phage replisome organizer
MKRYYWLKLHRDFFKRHDVKIMEAQENGKEYVLFYLKLLTESIDHEGRLRYSDTVPYDEKMLSIITCTNIDIVRSAVSAFVAMGLMERWDDGTFFMSFVNNMVGSETDSAVRQRLTRQREVSHCAKMSQICHTEIEKEKDIEKDKEHKKPASGVQFSFITDEDWRELFTTWARNKKNPYRKQIGAEKGFAHLQSLSQNNIDIARQIVDNSLANNWTGLFAVKGGEISDQPTINPYAVELAERLRRNGN